MELYNANITRKTENKNHKTFDELMNVMLIEYSNNLRMYIEKEFPEFVITKLVSDITFNMMLGISCYKKNKKILYIDEFYKLIKNLNILIETGQNFCCCKIFAYPFINHNTIYYVISMLIPPNPCQRTEIKPIYNFNNERVYMCKVYNIIRKIYSQDIANIIIDYL